LDSGLGGDSTKRNLNWNMTLPTIIIGVIGTPQTVFTNLIMISHVNRNPSRPPMSSERVQKCRCNEFKRKILITICCNCTNYWSQRWPLC
jgi:hypothetical protein